MSGLPTDTAALCEEALRHLLTLGCGTVIITLGREGAMFASARDSVVQYERGTPQDHPVDTTVRSLVQLLVYPI